MSLPQFHYREWFSGLRGVGTFTHQYTRVEQLACVNRWNAVTPHITYWIDPSGAEGGESTCCATSLSGSAATGNWAGAGST